MATEKRLIDANALRGKFRERYDDAFMQIVTRTNEAYWNGYANGINWGINTITDAQNVDAVEVVHGRWLPYHEADIGYDEYGIRCSNCRLEFENHEVNFPINYCPNCGAKMDGDGNG